MIRQDEFLLNPGVTYLNHGSFGACPKLIFEDYQMWQRRLEMDPVQFITKIGPTALARARQALGDFLSCSMNDLVFVPNPTYAINTIAKSLILNPGDEILSTDLEYGAMDRTWSHYCEKTGAKYIQSKISLPVQSKEEIIREFFTGLTDRTKVVFISEITSTTALKLPAREICAIAKEKGLITIVDGAHSPAHIPVDLSDYPCDYYTGACHKWMFTPKGSSFLYVHPDFQDSLDPLVVSWGYQADFPSDSQFLDYHQFNGTRDFSAYLTLPMAIDFLAELDWEKAVYDSQTVILDQYPRFCALLNSHPICPVEREFLGMICSIPIQCSRPAELKELLFEKYEIEIPIMPHKGAVYLRISYCFYNDQSDLEHLYTSLKDILETTDLIG